MNLTNAMCWKLIARKVQTAIWTKEDDDVCLKQNADKNLVKICDSEDTSKPSWKAPLRNCVRLTGSNSQKLPPRHQRPSVYSESLISIGLSELLY